MTMFNPREILLVVVLLMGSLKLSMSESLEIEVIKGSTKQQVEDRVITGRYSIDDLLEAAQILLNEKRWVEAQRSLEVAQQMRPKDLSIKKALAQIYQETKQWDQLDALAKSVSSYLLPGGVEDDFYETMLSIAIRLNAKDDPDFAWNSFIKLYTTLKDKPGRLSNRIRELEELTYVPFLSRIYQFMEGRKIYGDFLWGRVGDYFLVQGDFSRAVYFLDKEISKSQFNRAYLYSQALAHFSLRQLSKAHVFINLALALNTDQEVISKSKALQRALETETYSFSWEEVRLEADYYFQFGEKDLGLKRLQELLLGTDRNPHQLVVLGKILLGYPEEWHTWLEGRDFLLQYANSTKPRFELLFECAQILYQQGFLEELTPILGKMEKIDPKKLQNSEEIEKFQRDVATRLYDDFKLMEGRVEDSELKDVLLTLIRFNPGIKELYIALGELMVRRAVDFKEGSLFYSESFQKDVETALILFEKAPRDHWNSALLQYFMGRLYGYVKSDTRQYSREIAYFKRAIERDKNLFAAKVGLAQVYFDAGFYRQSFRQATMVIEDKKVDQKWSEEAQKIARVAYRAAASQAYAEENHFLVLDYLGRAIALNGGETLDHESSLWYANALVYAEEYEKSDSFLDQMLQKYGEDSQIYYLLALTHERLYKLEDAMIYYQKAIDAGVEGNLFVEQCRQNLEHLREIVAYRDQELEVQ